MDERRVGRSVRALRLRLGLRQVDVARRASVPQSTVSLVERGRISRLQVATVRAVAEAVGGEWEIGIRWRGADLDRLVDARHATLVSVTKLRLEDAGWAVHPEVTYSVFGERGSVDLLAWHPASATALVVEAKTALGSLEETLRRHDAKARLAPRIAAERFGLRAAVVGRLLVMPEAATPRRQVARADTVLRGVYPLRGVAMRRWLAHPVGPASGLVFLSPSVPGDGHHRRRASSRASTARAAREDARGPSSNGADAR